MEVGDEGSEVVVDVCVLGFLVVSPELNLSSPIHGAGFTSG